MRVVIASDIHGSAYYANKLKERFIAEKADQLILLGDIYYHGPRNDLSYEYDPQKVADILNSFWINIVCVKGNCDSEVDEMISRFSFIENMELFVSGKKVYLAHGHKINWDFPNYYGDIVIFGHLHTGFIKKENDVIIANTGSVSLPKNGTKNSYIVLTDDKIELKDIDGNVIESEAVC